MSPAEQLQRVVLDLPDVTQHHEFGDLAWFVDGIMFAALAGSRVTMHLPAAEVTAALRKGSARPVVSMGAVGRNGWVEFRLDGLPEGELARLLKVAHAAARSSRRRGRAARPGQVRRRSPSRR